MPEKIEASPSSSSSPVVEADVADAGALLLEFFRQRDVECPRCGYNLRDLTTPVCPECREHLSLKVGAGKVRLGWFVASIIPGAFSGISAMILALPIILVPLFSPQPPAPPGIVLLDIGGWLSGGLALAIFVARQRFLRLPHPVQAKWAIVLWVVHVTAFVIVVLATI